MVFNDGEIVIVDGSEVSSVIVSEQGDTIVHAGLEEIPISAPSVQGDFRIFEIEVGMRQAATLSTDDILGEWILYRQQAVTTEQTIEGNEVEQLLRFNFSATG